MSTNPTRAMPAPRTTELDRLAMRSSKSTFCRYLARQTIEFPPLTCCGGEHLLNALHRLSSVRNEIIRQSCAGELTLKIRHRSGGAWKDYDPVGWNIDRPEDRFRSGIIDPEYLRRTTELEGKQ